MAGVGGDVGHDIVHLPAGFCRERFGRRAQRFLGARGDDHSRAFQRQAAGRGPPHALAAAEYKGRTLAYAAFHELTAFLLADHAEGRRTDERAVWEEWVSQCRSQWE